LFEQSFVYNMFMEFLKQNKKIIVYCVVLFGLGISLGTIITGNNLRKKNNLIAAQTKPVHSSSVDYKFINPLLGYDTAKATEFGEYQDLQDKLQKKVDSELSNSAITKFSVYFRDLSRGRWLGVNEDEQFSPASLLKVPLMMAYYRVSESNPDILNKSIKFVGGSDINSIETIKGSQHIQVGTSYTVDELINYMIIYSDNDALALLYNNIDPKDLTKFYNDFGILLPDVEGSPQDFISPKTYGLFFRVLYGATYLNRLDSEKALELLAKVEYTNGLVAGIPINVDTAHKFGEYGSVVGGQIVSRELHDCGIVFYPNHPYLLCVMTKGADLNNLQRIIKETSQIVYDAMKKTYK
jgi:beta-lactamase class A